MKTAVISSWAKRPRHARFKRLAAVIAFFCAIAACQIGFAGPAFAAEAFQPQSDYIWEVRGGNSRLRRYSVRISAGKMKRSPSVQLGARVSIRPFVTTNEPPQIMPQNSKPISDNTRFCANDNAFIRTLYGTGARLS